MKSSTPNLSVLLISLTTLVSILFPSSGFAKSVRCEKMYSEHTDLSKADHTAHRAVTLAAWFNQETHISLTKIFTNISPADSLPGVVVAAQTRHSPNYYYHWVRDAGLVIDSLVSSYQVSTSAVDKTAIRQKLSEYIDFSDHIQQTRTLTGLGEPKFNVDGSAYNDPWGRPQNDSPALRAISFLHWAKVLAQEGDTQTLARLYKAEMPANSVIKRDLEYVSHHWRDSSFDLWEEVRADHFYTRMVQRRAMIEGAALARQMGDTPAALWYAEQGREIEATLNSFWDANKGFIGATQNHAEGLNGKVSNVDTAVILGLLHGGMNDGFMAFSDPRVLATLQKIEDTFKAIYPVNQNPEAPGVAIGRYPEDVYGGADFNGGNPWPLCTLAVAEAYYRAAGELEKSGQSTKAQELIAKGDQFVARVQFHSHADGSLNEQINRNTGYMTSVSDLTWNYAAILTTSLARTQVAAKNQTMKLQPLAK